MNELLKTYSQIRKHIIKRLKEFKCIYVNKDIDAIINEMLFCILTPQSKANICWKCINNLIINEDIYKINKERIREYIKSVRFYNNKSEYIYQLIRKLKTKELDIEVIVYSNNSIKTKRKTLVKNIKGYGFKEASHFLRNIGLGKNIAILDRHILKNLVNYNIIDNIPLYLTESYYYNIENKMRVFANSIDIPLSHLDLLFWYNETGHIFK